MRRLLTVCVLAVGLGAGAPARALTLAPCPGQSDFQCGTLRVPLDRADRLPGTIAIHFAVQASGPKPILVALSGGPGQSAVSSATSFATSLASALHRYRLVVLDQRGTGGSGALNCPQLQRAGELSIVPAALDARCAAELGPQRAFYSTTDTVLDINALRQALGARRIAVMGVSYGTFVAQQYARRFPTHVARLILDSVVPAGGVDAYSLDIYPRMSRVLRTQCARSLCSAFTRDPVIDVAALDERLLARPLTGRVPDDTGRLTEVTLHNAAELINLVVGGDLNAFMQPAIPSAIDAALHGDAAPLLRLRRIAEGPPVARTDLSAGLNIATFCEDTTLPYSLTATPLPDRPALIQQGLDAIPSAALGPVDRQTTLVTSIAANCARWPQDQIDPISTAPLPDVPALILDGELDLRTPLENGAALAAGLPHAEVVVVPGLGHDELDDDVTGCTVKALARFVDNHPVGHPCVHALNQIDPYPTPPLTLRAFTAAPDTTGTRGRMVAAVIATTIDGYQSLLERAFAGFHLLSGGGLRSGRFSGTIGGQLHLIDYSYVPGVRLSGRLRTTLDLAVGTLHVDGPGHFDGALTFAADGAVTGRIGGRTIHSRIGDGVATAATNRGPSAGPSLRDVLRRLPVARRAWRAAMAG